MLCSVVLLIYLFIYLFIYLLLDNFIFVILSIAYCIESYQEKEVITHILLPFLALFFNTNPKYSILAVHRRAIRGRNRRPRTYYG